MEPMMEEVVPRVSPVCGQQAQAGTGSGEPGILPGGASKRPSAIAFATALCDAGAASPDPMDDDDNFGCEEPPAMPPPTYSASVQMQGTTSSMAATANGGGAISSSDGALTDCSPTGDFSNEEENRMYESCTEMLSACAEENDGECSSNGTGYGDDPFDLLFKTIVDECVDEAEGADPMVPAPVGSVVLPPQPPFQQQQQLLQPQPGMVSVPTPLPVQVGSSVYNPITKAHGNHQPGRKKGPSSSKSPTQQHQQDASASADGANCGRWSKEEHRLFLRGLQLHGKDWKSIAPLVQTRTVVQVRTHAQKYFQKLAKEGGGGGGGANEMEAAAAAPATTTTKAPVGSKLKGPPAAAAVPAPPSSMVPETNRSSPQGAAAATATAVVGGPSSNFFRPDPSNFALAYEQAYAAGYSQGLRPTASTSNPLISSGSRAPSPMETLSHHKHVADFPAGGAGGLYAEPARKRSKSEGCDADLLEALLCN